MKRILQRKLQALFFIMVGIIAPSSYVFAETTQANIPEVYAQYPTIGYGAGAKAEQLQRGEYLVKMGDCIACHTEKNGQPFAGGLAFSTPFGILYSPNITGDKETGIGNWSEAQFFKAVREGISPKKEYYYPAFPFIYYNKITDQDLRDIKAYLDAIPAVRKAHYQNHMMFPFNWRFLQLGWRILFFNFKKTGPYHLDTTKTPTWNRGAYLVEGLTHCDMCHTPMYYMISKKMVLGAPNLKYHLAGGFVNGFYAPDITGTRMTNISTAQLANVFLRNHMLGGGEVQGPMREANEDSFKYLTNGDIEAIHSYLVGVKSAKAPPMKMGTGLAGGKKIYEQYCVGCHSTGAGGAPRLGDKAAWETLQKQGLDKLYQYAIQGIDGMPAKGTCATCSEEDIKNAVQYILKDSVEGTNVQPVITPPKALNLEEGKRIYQQYCQACHNGSYPGAPKVGDKATWQPLIKKGMDVLILNSINGINNMPPRGSCAKCNAAEVKAAVKYMVEESKTEGNYQLW